MAGSGGTMTVGKPFVCRHCSRTLAIATSHTIHAVNGVQLLVGAQATLRCECGRIAIWKRLSVSGSLVIGRPQ